MPARVKPLGHEDRLSIVDHLDELRSRLVVCVAALVVCFSFTYWQNDAVLKFVNQPFVDSQKSKASEENLTGGDALEQRNRFNRQLADALKKLGPAVSGQQSVIEDLADVPGVDADTLAAVRRSAAAALAASAAIRTAADGVPLNQEDKPITIGVTEPFVTTFTVSGYAALLLALPLILFQLYAFLLPAFSPQERKTAVPFMAMVPVLFICGVAFGYYVALPRAVDFLLNFNDDNFDILVGAKDYYKFSIVLLLVVGLLFQVPVGVLAVTRLGIVTPQQLAKNRGYIFLGIAVVAAVATPTPDPFTMLVTMLPLVLLFEASLLLARIFQKRSEGKPSRWDWDEDDDDDDPDDDDGPDVPTPEGEGPAEGFGPWSAEDDPYGFHADQEAERLEEPEPVEVPDRKPDELG